MIAATGSIVFAFWLFVAAANIVLSGMFAGMETGAYLLNRVRLELQAEAGRPRARGLRAFLHDPNHLLATLLMGTNIHQYAATFAVSVLFVMVGREKHAEWYTLAVTTPLLFVFKDSLPKNFFQRSPERLVYTVIPWVRTFDALYKTIGLTYLVRAFAHGLLRLLGRTAARPTNLLGHEALQSILAEGHAVSALTGAQREMADRVLRIGEVHVADVYHPMERVLSAPGEIARDEFLRRAAEQDYSSVLLRNADGGIIGVVDVHDVLMDPADRPISVHAREPLVISSATTVTRAMYILQRARQSLAVVADETGKPIGIVTMKDLVEVIVGELRDG